jgi:hypothetical protein
MPQSGAFQRARIANIAIAKVVICRMNAASMELTRPPVWVQINGDWF